MTRTKSLLLLGCVVLGAAFAYHFCEMPPPEAEPAPVEEAAPEVSPEP